MFIPLWEDSFYYTLLVMEEIFSGKGKRNFFPAKISVLTKSPKGAKWV